MVETSFQRRAETIRKYLQRRITAKQAVLELGCSQRTIRRYKVRLLKNGIEGLKDRRRVTIEKLTAGLISQIINLKNRDRGDRVDTSGDRLLRSADKQAVWRVLTKAPLLMRLNAERLKPLRRFVAKYPNDLWQSDVMGR